MCRYLWLTAKKGILSDTGENRGLRIACGKTGRKTFTYRYRSPESGGKLVQIKLGTFPDMSLEQARIKLREMKAIRERGICPKADLERQEQERRKLLKTERVNSITLKDVIDHYLENYIQDRFTSSAGADQIQKMIYLKQSKYYFSSAFDISMCGI